MTKTAFHAEYGGIHNAGYLDLFRHPLIAMLQTATDGCEISETLAATLDFFNQFNEVDLCYSAAISWR